MFCDIRPFNGLAVKPRDLSIRDNLRVALQVLQKIMKLFPAISFMMWTKYSSFSFRGL